MSLVIGKWKSKERLNVYASGCTFELPENTIVQVSQEDVEGKQILVDFGDRCKDWMPRRFLNSFIFFSELV